MIGKAPDGHAAGKGATRNEVVRSDWKEPAHMRSNTTWRVLYADFVKEFIKIRLPRAKGSMKHFSVPKRPTICHDQP